MFSSDDMWPLPNYGTGPTKHMHALGVISLNYNTFEAALRFILNLYVPNETTDFFFDQWNNEERCAAIRHFSQREEKDAEVMDRIDHLLKHFSICNENRNHLMHSRHKNLRGATASRPAPDRKDDAGLGWQDYRVPPQARDVEACRRRNNGWRVLPVGDSRIRQTRFDAEETDARSCSSSLIAQ
jgi:hypothetical protein